MDIIDFHTHAFPDALAARAMPALEAAGDIKGKLDGTVSALLKSMDAAGIAASVVASIATRPEQFAAILRWSAAIASDRIIPFPSVHPASPEAPAQVRTVAAEGFRGVKLHPYYQEFDLDEERLDPLYEAANETGLLILMHTGFDLAYERIRRADPARFARVMERHPGLRLVASHMGAWEDWDEVRRVFLGRQWLTDISFATQFMAREEARALIHAHPATSLIFGSDSPWADQGEAVAALRALELDPELEGLILSGNARRLLGL